MIKYEYSDETWTILSEPEDYEQYISRGTMGFSIDGYGYIRGDYELYRYDPLNNAWHTGDELPPGGRAYSITFEMDGKVYLGSSFNNKYDLWELDPAFE